MTGFGFRPALTDVALGAPIDAAHGADPKEPQTLLAAPNVRVLRALLDTWNENKRGVDMVVVFDRSGSMAGRRLKGAREGLEAFLGDLRPDDKVVLETFSGDSIRRRRPRARRRSSRGSRLDLRGRPDGALRRDPPRPRPRRSRRARATGRTSMRSSCSPTARTTGRRPSSPSSWRSSPRRSRATASASSPSVTAARPARTCCGQIAQRAGGAYYHGDVDNIRSVYEEIGSFF